MCAQSQPYSRMKHALLSAYGAQWSKRYLAVFTVYIDDSGTDPAQPVAIASALIFPAMRLVAMEREWEALKAKEGFTCLHTSECAARNPRSDFALWDQKKVGSVLKKVRQFIFKYSVQSFSVAVSKSDHDSIIPGDFKRFVGRYHYTWAVDQACGFIEAWAQEKEVPMEYIFDMAGKNQKKEIDAVMEHGEARFPGRFLGHHSFRNRCELPALQCADLFAWTCFQQARWRIKGKTLTPLAKENWDAFSSFGDDREAKWCGAWTATPDALSDWVKKVQADKAELARLQSLRPAAP
jgi:hypothetical protein